MPLLVRYSRDELDFKLALRYHLFLESGLRPTDIQAFVTYRSYPWTMLQKLGILRCHCLSFLEREEKNLAALRLSGASSLISYPSCLAPLAHCNAENGHGIRLKAVFSSAEHLSGGMRAAISRSFGCPVRDRYGAIETGSIAWECEKGSMHIYDSVLAEVVDDAGRPLGPGKAGNLVVTPLWRYSMPFIRYVIGDRASLGRGCACGRGLPVLASLDGRRDQQVVLPSGRRYIAAAIGARLRQFGLLQFQAVQEERGKLRLVLIPLPGRPRPEKSSVRAEVQSILPEPMEIEVEFAERPERSPRGKMRDFISRMI
jgi:phenylacetate-CoA ligase